MKTAAKDFKMTELGPIPKDWEVWRIGELGDVVTGSTPPRGDDECWGGAFNWISAKDFKGKYIVDAEEKVTAKGESFCRLLPPDSVLVTCIASIGLNAIAKRPCATNQQINAVVCKSCDNEFLYYQVEAAKKRMMEMAGQTAVPIINKGDFENLLVSLPPLPEQRKIAAALSDVDEMIAALEKLIEKKRKIKTGAMQRLLTGKTRLPGFKGAWVEKRLGDCGEWLKGQPFAKSEMGKGGLRECVHYGELFTIYHEVIGRIESRTDARPVVVSRRGDILFPASDVTPTGLGRCSALMKDDVVLGGDLIVLRTEQEMHAPFLSYVINLNKAQIIERVTGTTVKHIRSGALAEVSFRCPPTLAEQKAIAKVLGDMDEEIAALEAELAKTRQLKQGMMQELLTGRVRLV